MITDNWLTPSELAGYLKISQSKLYRMAQNGEIPASKIGIQWRFNREEIDTWGKNQKPANCVNPLDGSSHKKD